MRSVVVFDDGTAGGARLSPLTDLRAAFDVRTGALTTLQRFERSAVAAGARIVGLAVPASIAALVRDQHSLPVNDLGQDQRQVLAVNGRAPLVSPEQLASWTESGGAIVDAASGGVVAAVVSARELPQLVDGTYSAAPARGAAAKQGSPLGKGQQLMTRPWHFRSMRDSCLKHDLEILSAEGPSAPLPSGAAVFGAHTLTIHPSASVLPGAVFDTSGGIIVLAAGATVRPGAVVCGPAYIGEHATVIDRAVIRGGTAIGPWCKAGGEIGGTIFQGYSNKGHDGYLGDSYVGEWVNLGAMTTNSNLLNTYGEVIAKCAPDAPNERTGEQFLGCVLGDHVKTAIGTRIMTGSVVGTGTMWAATAPMSGAIAAFGWVTDAGRRHYRHDKFLEVAGAVMSRRKVTPSASYIALLKDLAERAAGE